MNGKFDANILRPASILVAESHLTARESLAELLSDDGYRVFQAADHSAAISCIDNHADIAVVLADLDMPNWQALVRHVNFAAPRAFVLGMVGWQTTSDVSELRRQGIYSCLTKPLAYASVQQAIRERLTGRR